MSGIGKSFMMGRFGWCASRCYSKKYVPSSKIVRQKFLDYFIRENNHSFVRSSPVVPYYDPTISFVNSGMIQFKNIFLGKKTPKYKKVANSQKCVRAGGKHNDLDVVGTDGYHHTFFEMLGNWSFGECSKAECCTLAWKLLTDVYGVSKNSLYVTYFGGDESLGLPPDLECKEVWKEIGVPESRIIPFGMSDNFWEMGASGPCGPCTEIHFDHLGGGSERAQFVNKGLHELIELWNIVFIEYNRDPNGKISPLPKKHVDTGMGFERLCAVLQGKVSNYDTDIFRTLFSAMQRICGDVPKYESYFGENDWDSLNTGYRILADHSRMVTACLADGMIPEENQKLRKVMRRAFVVSTNTFKKEKGLLKELSNYVIENLGPVYPEMENKSKQIHQIIDYEEEVYKSLRTNASDEWTKIVAENPSLISLDVIEMPGLVHAFKEIKNSNVKEITPHFGHKLFDTYGLDEDTISRLCASLSIKFSAGDFKKELDRVKNQSKQLSVFNSAGLEFDFGDIKTDDSFKYAYQRGDFKGGYLFKDLDVRVLRILKDSEFVEGVSVDTECGLIFDKTNLYVESGGQISDTGEVDFGDLNFEIYDVKNVNGAILHTGIFKHKNTNADNKRILRVNSEGKLKINPSTRLCNMRNHTSTHLLNAFLKELKGSTCQKSSKVTDKWLNLDVGVFSEKVAVEDVVKIEEKMRQVIRDAVDVQVKEIDCQKLMELDQVTLIPGEVYPEDGIRLVQINWNNQVLSREPCCGTHILNTADIEDFCIVSCKSLGRSTTSLYAVTAERARMARNNGRELLSHISKLQDTVYDNIDKPDVLDMAVATLRQRLNFNVEDDTIIPVAVKHECSEKLNSISKQIKETTKNNLKEFVDMEMKSVLGSKVLKSESEKDFVVHYLRTSMILDNVPLQRATKICQNIPVMVISYSDSIVKARCCVPQEFNNEHFNAEKWLKVIGYIFKSPVVPPKGQDPQLVCNMKGKKIGMSDWHGLLRDSLDSAILFAKKHL